MSASDSDSDPYQYQPDFAENWSHCLRAGQSIEDVLSNMIRWHFDPDHVALVEDWLQERIASHVV
jgi:hypothetical protein